MNVLTQSELFQIAGVIDRLSDFPTYDHIDLELSIGDVNGCVLGIVTKQDDLWVFVPKESE